MWISVLHNVWKYMIGHSWVLLRFSLDQQCQFVCWLSSIRSSKSLRSWTASLLHDWGSPAPWAEPMCPPPVYVSFLRTRCRPAVSWEGLQVDFLGREEWEKPQEKREGRREREQAILIVLKTLGRSPSIRCLLQRSFPPCFYIWWGWKKYLSNFCIIYIFQCFQLHWDALIHQNK